jgi:hypothetical protein
MVKYEVNSKEYQRQINDQGGHRAVAMQEHSSKVQMAIQSKRILLRGETPQTEESQGESSVAVAKPPKEIFYIYNARDEREPFHFIKSDSLF